MLELALGSLLLFGILLGIADFGRVFYHSIAAVNAAQAGVQYGASGRTSDFTGMQQAAVAAAGVSGLTAAATSYCQCADGTVVNCSSGSCSAGSKRRYLQVKVSGSYKTIVNFPGIPSTVPVGSTAIRRVL